MKDREKTIPLWERLKMLKVNLDALIPREDLEVKELTTAPISIDKISISQLRDGEFFLETLRKPDFQRETSEWTPERVYNLVQSFVNGDLIPALILWRGEGNNFVIDGAHRLSALIAWVTDDYGYGNISKSFFEQNITEEQISQHEKTKKLIDKNIGTYNDIVWAINNKDDADESKLAIAKRLSALSIQLQWVPGDASNAEKSFLKINEEAAPINETEKKLLQLRRKPNSIAARAIIHAGTGHKYWHKFTDEKQEKIESLSKGINDLLFSPKLKTPIKTLDIPIAGRGYSSQTLELILSIVNFSNGIKVEDKSHKRRKKDISSASETPDDKTGDATIDYLINTKHMLSNITGTESSSLGLHPAIYFYSRQGRYQVTAFMAFMELIKDYEQRKQLQNFILIRRKFESFLWDYKSIVNQATVHYGSGVKGYKQLAKVFDFIASALRSNKKPDEIIEMLDKHEEYGFFKPDERELNPKNRKEFSTESKSEVFMRDGISSAVKCKICNGYTHVNSITIDHVIKKENKGAGNADNGQVSHPYCNSIRDNLTNAGYTLPLD